MTNNIKKNKRINTKKLNAEKYIPFYEFLLYDDKYRNLSNTAKILYCYYRNKLGTNEFWTEQAELGVEGVKSYRDEQGDVFVIADNSELQIILQVSEPTVTKATKELVKFNLLEDPIKTEKGYYLWYVLEPQDVVEESFWLEDVKKLREEKEIKRELKKEKSKAKKAASPQEIEKTDPSQKKLGKPTKENSGSLPKENLGKSNYNLLNLPLISNITSNLSINIEETLLSYEEQGLIDRQGIMYVLINIESHLKDGNKIINFTKYLTKSIDNYLNNKKEQPPTESKTVRTEMIPDWVNNTDEEEKQSVQEDHDAEETRRKFEELKNQFK